jgi:hypothetical protein
MLQLLQHKVVTNNSNNSNNLQQEPLQEESQVPLLDK